MSEKTDKKSDHAEEGKDGKKKGGIMALLTKTPVLLGGAMLIEAIVIIGVFQVMGGGAKEVEGAELHAEADGGHGGSKSKGGHGEEGGEGHVDPESRAELLAIEMRAQNKLSGRTFLYDVSIYVGIRQKNAEKVKAILEARKALISDRVRTIIAQSDPAKLDGGKEPGLETLRRQVKFQLDEIIGEDLIEEVLVPRCIPYRADF